MTQSMLQDKATFEERMFDYDDPDETNKKNKGRQ